MSAARRTAASGARHAPDHGRAVITVLIADDQELLRDGLSVILDAQDDMEVVGQAADGRDAIARTRETMPDVVLMDVRMPVMDGIEATRQLRGAGFERLGILMLTTFDLDEYVYEALRAGANGFLLKDVPRATVVEGVRTIAAGESLLAPAITRRLIERHASGPPDRGAPPPQLELLSPRERDTLSCLARGRSNAEIAGELVLSEATVKTHVAAVLRKLGLRDRTQAVVWAYESGLVPPGELDSP
jgi:DNA-binding NarL/FixJ family response regulator